MDIQAYINSGILEEYCLGLLSEEDQAYLIQMAMLYPEIKHELLEVEAMLEKLAESNAIEPDPLVKQRILDSLCFADIGQHADQSQYPAVSKNTDHKVWLRALSHLIPDDPSEDISIELIRKDEHLEQMLVISKTDIPEEEHGNYLESFLILEGRCECTVGDSVYQLSAGDFIEIPLHVKHDIRILTPHVTAVLQYEFI